MKISLADLYLTPEERADFRRPALQNKIRKIVVDRAPRDESGSLICGICEQAIRDTFHLNHKERWADIRHQALNDPEVITLPRHQRRNVLKYLYNDPENLEPVHPRCNDRHTHRLDKQVYAEHVKREKTR